MIEMINSCFYKSKNNFLLTKRESSNQNKYTFFTFPNKERMSSLIKKHE